MAEPQIEFPDLADEAVAHLNVAQVLKHRAFRFLWFSQVLSQVGGHVLNFSLVLTLYERTHSNTLVSLLLALVSLPPILFSSLAGVYADNFNRKYILLGSNFVRAGIVLVLLAAGDQPTVLILLAFCVSTVSQFFGPAESSSIASLVHRRGYFAANSLFVFTTYTAFLVGYSLAGPALQFLGETRTYTVLVSFFLLATAANAFLPQLRDHLAGLSERSVLQRAFGNLRSELREGWRFLRGNRLLLVIVLLVATIFSFERAIISLLPDLAQRVLGYSLDAISYFVITPAGLGAFAGALTANWLKVRVEKTKIIVSGMLIAAGTLLFFPLIGWMDALVPSSRTDLVAFVGTLAFLSGFGDVLIIIAAQTLIHELTTARTRGRVFGSLVTLMNAVGLPLILLVGYLGSRFPVLDIYFGIGALLTFLVLASTALFRRALRVEA